MKLSKAQIHARVHGSPELRFEDQRLTSFSGCILLQALFQKLKLREEIQECFSRRNDRAIIGMPTIVMILILHLMLGYLRLRDIDRYRDDPVVLRALGLKRMPDVSTISRNISHTDRGSVENVRLLSGECALDRLRALKAARITLDFDGSVISTGRYAEGSAVGYNKNKKGALSYYPLFCTISQTGQVLDVPHRAGNVHDSRDSLSFTKECIKAVRSRLPEAIIESRRNQRLRKDSAFFSDKTVDLLEKERVQFTISGIERHDRNYHPLASSGRRVGLFRKRLEPVQLNLFVPR